MSLLLNPLVKKQKQQQQVEDGWLQLNEEYFTSSSDFLYKCFNLTK